MRAAAGPFDLRFYGRVKFHDSSKDLRTEPLSSLDGPCFYFCNKNYCDRDLNSSDIESNATACVTREKSTWPFY